MTILAIPNVSEGRDPEAIRRLARSVSAASGAVLLDTHSDADHHRTVFTIAARGAERSPSDPGEPVAPYQGTPAHDAGSGAPGLVDAIVGLVAAARAEVDLRAHDGAHPRVGVVDVAPVVYLDESGRGAAAAAALLLADRVGSELELPVFLYGELTEGRRTRADLRRGGPERLAARIAAGELRPDFGPPALHPTAGAVLVAARPPLIAANFELAPPASLDDARAIAARIRDGGPDGLPSVRAIGIALHDPDRAQVSTNIEDHRAQSVAAVLAAIGRYARVTRIEIVGLPPAAALTGLRKAAGRPGEARAEIVCAGTIEAALSGP